MSEVFPEEDFCIYKDYPFDQLVFSRQYCKFCRKNGNLLKYLKKINPSYSCTYLWINQYYPLHEFIFQNDTLRTINLYILINSSSYKNINKCNFKRRLALCNRSDYHLKDIWGIGDYLILNKKIQIVVKILTYLVSLFSIATNIVVIRIIFAKHNNNVFKDFKHYTYLGLISVFSLSISLIEILSWMSECFYPFEVFCLGVHKTVAAQLFKMVVKECVGATLRFLSNFCYLVFALSRISKIDQNHGAFIKFMSNLAIWKYILFSLFISMAFSWIKYFKYSINFGHGELNFPISNERDIATSFVIFPSIIDFYFVFNVISDLLNYFVFVIVCFIIDLLMIFRMGSNLNETKEITSLNENQENQIIVDKNESENTLIIKYNFRMFIFNILIGIFFKFPLVFLPLVNTIAKFYYRDLDKRYNNQAFDHFYTHLIETDFYSLFNDIAQFLFLFSLSIQYFIYKKYDKKFNEGTFTSPPNLNEPPLNENLQNQN